VSNTHSYKVIHLTATDKWWTTIRHRPCWYLPV